MTLSGYVLSMPSTFSWRWSRLSIPFALSPLLRHVFANGVRPLLAEGRLPIRWAPSEPMGLAVSPPISPSTALVSLHILPSAHGSSGRCFILFLRDVPQVFMAIIFVSFTGLCAPRPNHSLRVVFIGHLQRRVTGLT